MKRRRSNLIPELPEPPRRKRGLSEEDRALWESVAKQVKPLRKRQRASKPPVVVTEADSKVAPKAAASPRHAALGLRPDLALAGDDEHEGQPVMMGALQEAEQRAMRARLRHAVQVEPGVDLLSSARQMRPLAAADWRQRRRLRL